MGILGNLCKNAAKEFCPDLECGAADERNFSEMNTAFKEDLGLGLAKGKNNQELFLFQNCVTVEGSMVIQKDKIRIVCPFVVW